MGGGKTNENNVGQGSAEFKAMKEKYENLIEKYSDLEKRMDDKYATLEKQIGVHGHHVSQTNTNMGNTDGLTAV